MTNEALAPFVTVAILALLAGSVPLLEAVASAWRPPRGLLRSEPQSDQEATASYDAKRQTAASAYTTI